MAYLLDANVFIQAKNLYYGFDFCPAFWEWLDTANAAGRVFSIERVGAELRAGDDELADWARARSDFFLALPSGVQKALASLGDWATGAGYDPAGVNEFLQAADYYLVAQALVDGHAAVTHERVSNSRKRIKIPNACVAFEIECLNPFDMLRREHARFVLGDTA